MKNNLIRFPTAPKRPLKGYFLEFLNCETWLADGVQIEFAKVFSIYFNFQIFHSFASTLMVVTTYLVYHIY